MTNTLAYFVFSDKGKKFFNLDPGRGGRGHHPNSLGSCHLHLVQDKTKVTL